LKINNTGGARLSRRVLCKLPADATNIKFNQNIFLAHESLHPPGHTLTATFFSDTIKETQRIPERQATCFHWVTQRNRPAISTKNIPLTLEAK